eukprot:NODE_569_length_1287_cov_128.141357_g410_i0.p3 GENE.NODE_569_length_1287_cov_128.141357_g410_i0~~NODE_569_length_1287_cov_128.141357_g410_i0.p3  ORF type:complete len:74 (-),score=20.86 NODE_569_length_1287_cov_128.141357_g410_i0:3-224(-)
MLTPPPKKTFKTFTLGSLCGEGKQGNKKNFCPLKKFGEAQKVEKKVFGLKIEQKRAKIWSNKKKKKKKKKTLR